MIFTESELICFNSVLDGKQIVGLNIKDKKEMDNKKYVEDTVESLKKKGIIDSNGQISKVGILPIKALEDYKGCERHIAINGACFGLINNQEVISIRKIDDNYDILRVNKLSIITELLQKSAFLRKDSKSQDYKSEEQAIDILELLIKNDNYLKDSLHINRYLKGEIMSNEIFFYDDNKGFKYDVIGKRLKEIQPCEVKKTIVDIFDIKVGE